MPPRVEAGTKAALLGLVDGAVGAGWSTARACSVLELDSRRCRRWQHRRGAGRLEDSTAGGTAVHAITPTERRAIVELSHLRHPAEEVASHVGLLGRVAHGVRQRCLGHGPRCVRLLQRPGSERRAETVNGGPLGKPAVP